MSDNVVKDSEDLLQGQKRRSACNSEEDASARKMVRTNDVQYVTLAEEAPTGYDSTVSEAYNETFHGRETDYVDSSGVESESDAAPPPRTPTPAPPPPPAPPQPPAGDVQEYEVATDSSNEECFYNDSNSDSEDFTMNENGPNRPIGPYMAMSPTPSVRASAKVNAHAPVGADVPVASAPSVDADAPVGADAPVASVPSADADAPIGADAPVASVSSVDANGPVAAPFDDYMDRIPSISDYETVNESGYHDDCSTDTGASNSDHDLYEFWTCARCGYQRNDRCFRFCDKCFKLRIKHFTKRPNHKRVLRRRRGEPKPRPRQRAAPISKTNGNNETNLKKDSGVSSITPSPKTEVAPIPSCSGSPSTSFEANLALLSARAKRRSASNPDEDSNLSSDLCMMCSKNPKNGAFMHTSLCHICCCYACAVRIWNERKQCPICNGKVNNVMRMYKY